MLHYLKDDVTQKIPVWRMISMSLSEIEIRSQRLADAIGGQIILGQSTIGGGSLPTEQLITQLVVLPVPGVQSFTKRLRHRRIITRIQDDRVVFDLRTVPPSSDNMLISTIQQLLA